MATKSIKKSNIEKRADKVKATVVTLHNDALKLSDNVVEETLATGAKWQKVLAKAIKGGVTIFGKQQEFVLDTLEDLKGQYISGNKRLVKLVGVDVSKAKKATVKKAVKFEKVATTTVEKAVKATTKKAKAVTAKAKATTSKAKAKVTKTTKKAVSPRAVNLVDNLKLVNGVGPKAETILNDAGIFTFKQLATTNIKNLRTILDAAGPRYRVLDPKTWKAQAQKLAKK